MPVDEVTEHFDGVGRLSCRTEYEANGQLTCTVTTYRNDESGVGADTAEVKVENVVTDNPVSAHREGRTSGWDFDWSDSECMVQRMQNQRKRLVCKG